MRKIIGISGARGVGKDTFGQVLVNNHGFKQIAFADELRAQIVKLWPGIADWHEILSDKSRRCISLDVLHANSQDFAFWVQNYHAKLFHQNGMSYREVTALVSKYWRELHGDDVWVNLVLTQIQNDPDSNYVITDMRLEREVEWLKTFAQKTKSNYHLVEVKRDGHDYMNDSEYDTRLPAKYNRWTIWNKCEPAITLDVQAASLLTFICNNEKIANNAC